LPLQTCVQSSMLTFEYIVCLILQMFREQFSEGESEQCLALGRKLLAYYLHAHNDDITRAIQSAKKAGDPLKLRSHVFSGVFHVADLVFLTDCQASEDVVEAAVPQRGGLKTTTHLLYSGHLIIHIKF
jgi:hypothetical protein